MSGAKPRYLYSRGFDLSGRRNPRAVMRLLSVFIVHMMPRITGRDSALNYPALASACGFGPRLPARSRRLGGAIDPGQKSIVSQRPADALGSTQAREGVASGAAAGTSATA